MNKALPGHYKMSYVKCTKKYITCSLLSLIFIIKKFYVIRRYMTSYNDRDSTRHFQNNIFRESVFIKGGYRRGSN